MEDKIEVGEFVKTKDGFIDKVKSTSQDFLQCKKSNLLKQSIVNHSKNIIDLIQVGDFVNMELVEDITGEYIKTNCNAHNKYWINNYIKTILTKEQFEQYCFRVGGKDEK